MQLRVNTLLHNGTYRIIRFISAGGFGCTYEAEHILLEKRVAIKEFFVKDFCNRDEMTSQVTVGTLSKSTLVDKMRRKFLDEARGLCKLHHRGIVSVSDVFEENGTAYFVMDYIDGKSLSEIIHEEGTMSEARAAYYISHVAEALRYVHENNRLHLDLKPGNIMIDSHDNPILIDFGASKQYDEAGGENTSTLMGKTPGYAPPEQMSNCVVKFTPATDIYALGATLYKLLTGETPIDASLRISGETLTPLPAGVSPSTRATIEAAMSMEKRRRPQSVKEFMDMLAGTVPAPAPAPVNAASSAQVKKRTLKITPRPAAQQPDTAENDDEVTIIGVEQSKGNGTYQTPQAPPQTPQAPQAPAQAPRTPEPPKPPQQKRKPAKEKRGDNSWWVWALSIFAAIIGFVGCFIGMYTLLSNKNHNTRPTIESVAAEEIQTDDEVTAPKREVETRTTESKKEEVTPAPKSNVSSGELTIGDHRYVGEYLNGVPHGKGTMYYDDTNLKTYDGQWVNGLRHGKGTLIWQSGDRYSGDFKNDDITGYGTYYWTDGNRYTGYLKNSERQGKGTLYFADGEKVEGTFSDDALNGSYTYYFTDGGKRVGTCRNWKEEGAATYYFADGRYVKENWRNGKQEGNEDWYYSNGTKYMTNVYRNGEIINTIEY